MRWFAFSLMLGCAALVGCEQPKETIEKPEAKAPSEAPAIASPTVESGSSAVTAESDAPAAVEASAPPTDPAAPAAAPATEPAPAAEPAAAPATEPPPAAAPSEPKPESASSASTSAARFVATKSVKVPTMMCPFSCWPKVKETLAAQPGVEGVQLAAQAKETEIDNPVVELKTNGEFNVEAAIAALEKANFADAVVVK